MSDRTAMTPVHPSVDTPIGASGVAETDPIAIAAGESLTVDIYTTASNVRAAHGGTGVDPTVGYPLVAGSRNTIVIARGSVLAFSGANGDVVTYTVLV